MAHLRQAGMHGGRTAVDPAHRPAQQPMLCRQHQHPHQRIPSRLVEPAAVQTSSQTCRCAREDDPAEHVWDLAGVLGGRGGARRGPGHLPARPCSRGLGTLSTAARNRDASGWT